MEALKNLNRKVQWFTQRITMILVWILFIGVLGLMALIFNFVGIREVVDQTYELGLFCFWFWMIISRVGFSIIWYVSADRLEGWLHRNGYFWFKPPKESYRCPEEPSVDKSGEIATYAFMFVVVVIVGFFIGEIAIRATQALFWWRESILFYLPASAG